jgi:hypothetical protein
MKQETDTDTETEKVLPFLGSLVSQVKISTVNSRVQSLPIVSTLKTLVATLVQKNVFKHLVNVGM